MGARLTFAFAVFAVAPIVANACAGENNPYVLVVTAGQRVGSDGRVIDTVQPETVLKVEFAERDRYWVDDGKVGWLDRSRVIPADQKAIARLTQMIKADLQNGRLVRARSSVWIVLGEPDKALADCNRAIELNPKDARAYCSRGRVWRVKEQNDRALADFDQCIRLDPTQAEAYCTRAAYWLEREDFERSIADSNEALRIDSGLQCAYVIRGIARMMSQIDREGAFADLEEAIRLDPRDFRPYEFFSFLLLSQKMPEMALKAINDAIQNNPSARAFSDRAIVHVTLEHLDLAIADCNEAIRLDPNLAQAWSRRGMVRLPKQQYDAAIADLTEAIRLDPKDFSPYNARGCAWHIKREFDRALADFDNAIRIKPNTPSGHHNRGRAWLCKGQYDRAIEDFTECIRIDPQSSKTHRDRAVARMLQRRPEAIDGFQAVIELEGWNKKSTEAAVFGYIAARLVGNAPAAKRFLDSSAGNVNDAWPSPLLKFLRHQIDEPALLGLANEIGQQTEVHYCAGMEDLLANHLDQAKSHFRWVQVHEEREAIHYDIAVRELKRLESKP